jgi:NAD+ diphosphatase
MQTLAKAANKRLIFSGNQLLLLKHEDHYQLPEFCDWPKWVGDVQYAHNIGMFNDYDCHAAEIRDAIEPGDSFVWMPLKSAIEHIDLTWFGVAARAYQAINWDKNHRFCGRCGQETVHKVHSLERRCEKCKLFFYPKISPSIIVMIQKENTILLARKPQFAAGIYALIAGFVEPGESLEETLHREVREEVGITVKNIRYFGSQPWPFPDSLMLGFIADYESGNIELRDGELEDAGWYDVNNLPGLPASSVSISRQMIDCFIKGENI